MKNRIVSVFLLLVFLVALTTNDQAARAVSGGQPSLLYVKISSADDLTRFASTQLPMYIMLDGGLLAGAEQTGQRILQAAGLTYQVLDPSLGSGAYYLAETRPSRPAPDFSAYGQVLLKLNSSVLLRVEPSTMDTLTQEGVELSRVTLTPKPLPTTQSKSVFPDQVTPDPIIQGMMDQVSETQVYTYDRQLAGELPVWVDNGWYTITSRNTSSGTPIQKATRYIGQHMSNDLGLEVEYYQWNNSTNPDVIGEIPGLVNPDDIFIIGAHIDDVNGTPGADDNASGSVATMIAADILSQFQWGCTMRFAFWTGEEQGLNGSHAYAQRAFENNENIHGYLNLDMIGWNTPASSPTIYLGYGSSVPHSLDLANLFKDVVDVYGINLIPVIGTQYLCCSDHDSFIQYGYPAILGIEGVDDFNPYYHRALDTPANTNPSYFTDYVKASIGTFAHISDCLIPNGVGHLDGHVTAADGGESIMGATVTAKNNHAYTYTYTTNLSGYYSLTLPADTYTVTVTSDGYQTAVMGGVVVSANFINTQNFTLQQVFEMYFYLPLFYR